MTEPKEYGKALFLLAKEAGCEELIATDIVCVLKAIEENPDYTRILDTPALSKDERVRLIDEAFRGVNEYLVNLIKLLAEKRAASTLPGALKGYSLAYDEDRGIERVEAVSAVSMTDKQLSALKAKLEALTGKQIIITNTVDASILGGVVLRYMGTQLDGSVKTRLESFGKSIKNLVI